jgi:glycosyltransferase involved in cell wall biosynthesis
VRIAQVAPLAESVPPKLYGGTERVIAWLTEELVQLGQDVTLFASGDSQTSAKLVSAWPRALRLGRPRSHPFAAHTALLEQVAQRVSQFDVIHAHIDWLHLPLLSLLGVPFLTTLHGRLDLPGVSDLMRQFPEAPFVAISNSQRAAVQDAKWVGTVYHGLPVNSLRPLLKPGDYLAFLGRLSRDKGPDVAIRIARAAGMPLRIAAKLARDEQTYFKKNLAPHIDGEQIRLVGEVNDAAKQEFLGHAAALLFPINWPEPFGLVMIEAMACGTPIIAFPAGSVPEVVEDGVSGFIVEGEEQAIQAVHRLKTLDRREVRAQFEQRFTVRRMAQEYLKCYEILSGIKACSGNRRGDRAL